MAKNVLFEDVAKELVEMAKYGKCGRVVKCIVALETASEHDVNAKTPIPGAFYTLFSAFNEAENKKAFMDILFEVTSENIIPVIQHEIKLMEISYENLVKKEKENPAKVLLPSNYEVIQQLLVVAVGSNIDAQIAFWDNTFSSSFSEATVIESMLIKNVKTSLLLKNLVEDLAGAVKSGDYEIGVNCVQALETALENGEDAQNPKPGTFDSLFSLFNNAENKEEFVNVLFGLTTKHMVPLMQAEATLSETNYSMLEDAQKENNMQKAKDARVLLPPKYELLRQLLIIAIGSDIDAQFAFLDDTYIRVVPEITKEERLIIINFKYSLLLEQLHFSDEYAYEKIPCLLEQLSADYGFQGLLEEKSSNISGVSTLRKANTV